MRRHRWLLVLGFTLVLTGCSGSQLIGVAKQPDGGVAVLSYCSNEGLQDVRLVSENGTTGVIEGADRVPQEVFVISAELLTMIEPADVVTIDADYAGSGFFGEPLTIEFGALEPGTVVISGFEPEFVTPEEFEERRVSCGFDSTALAVVIGVAIGVVLLVALAIALPIIGVLLYLRRRRRQAEVTAF